METSTPARRSVPSTSPSTTPEPRTTQIMPGSLITISHPVVGATLSKLRRAETSPKEFREVTEQ